MTSTITIVHEDDDDKDNDGAMMMMPMDHLMPVHAGRTITIVHKDNNDNDQRDVYSDDDDADGSPDACTCREDNYNCS